MRLDHLLSKEEEVEIVSLFSCQKNNKIFLVAMRSGGTPVLIPNTMGKTLAAEGTILETIWESRRLPDFKGA